MLPENVKKACQLAKKPNGCKYVEHLLSTGYTVYEFNNSKELFRWLSDNV